MIISESTYNPLKNIFKLLDVPTVLNSNILENIKLELELGGIRFNQFENDEEFTKVLQLILESYNTYNGN